MTLSREGRVLWANWRSREGKAADLCTNFNSTKPRKVNV
jgi:hypothetical protein